MADAQSVAEFHSTVLAAREDFRAKLAEHIALAPVVEDILDTFDTSVAAMVSAILDIVVAGQSETGPRR